MDRYQKQAQRELLVHEKKIRDRLKNNYKAALTDVKTMLKAMVDDPKFQPEKVRQAKYLLMLEAQLETILHGLGDKNVTDMTAYLDTVYHEAYTGCLYGIQKDGVDMILRVDEDKVRTAINQETKGFKFSKRLYKNVEELKKNVKSEITRGFSNGSDYKTMARQIGIRAGTSFSRAYTIARTEGHRVENQSKLACMGDAREKGADVVKQWDSTLDDVTRATHRELDGQIRELDEEFVVPSTGSRAACPGGFGIAKEDINCRCCMLQRARWNIDSEAYKYSRAAGQNVSIKSDIYREWKNRYNKVVDLLLVDVPGNTKEEAAVNRVNFALCYSRLSDRVQAVLQDYTVEFGHGVSQVNLSTKMMMLENGVSQRYIYHEIGHVLEKELFDDKEVDEFKKQYLTGLSEKNIVMKEAVSTTGKIKGKIWIVEGDRFLNSYQGRLYIEEKSQGTYQDGSIKTEYLEEFMSVAIEAYYWKPDILKSRDKELYEFIRRYVE